MKIFAGLMQHTEQYCSLSQGVLMGEKTSYFEINIQFLIYIGTTTTFFLSRAPLGIPMTIRKIHYYPIQCSLVCDLTWKSPGISLNALYLVLFTIIALSGYVS